MHKLSSVEAQRVVGVLDNTVQNLQVIHVIPQLYQAHIHEALEEKQCDAAIACLEKQIQLENECTQRGFQSKGELHSNTRNLCRLLR